MHNFVMVIDDSATIRKVLEVSLKREGFIVVSFPDGIEALRWLNQPNVPTPALIFLDVNMPKIDGYSLASYIKHKNKFQNTTIVMLTRRDGVVDRLRARLAGATHYLTKPCKTEDIVNVVQSYLTPVLEYS